MGRLDLDIILGSWGGIIVCACEGILYSCFLNLSDYMSVHA